MHPGLELVRGVRARPRRSRLVLLGGRCARTGADQPWAHRAWALRARAQSATLRLAKRARIAMWASTARAAATAAFGVTWTTALVSPRRVVLARRQQLPRRRALRRWPRGRARRVQAPRRCSPQALALDSVPGARSRQCDKDKSGEGMPPSAKGESRRLEAFCRGPSASRPPTSAASRHRRQPLALCPAPHAR